MLYKCLRFFLFVPSLPPDLSFNLHFLSFHLPPYSLSRFPLPILSLSPVIPPSLTSPQIHRG